MNKGSDVGNLAEYNHDKQFTTQMIISIPSHSCNFFRTILVTIKTGKHQTCHLSFDTYLQAATVFLQTHYIQ